MMGNWDKPRFELLEVAVGVARRGYDVAKVDPGWAGRWLAEALKTAQETRRARMSKFCLTSWQFERIMCTG